MTFVFEVKKIGNTMYSAKIVDIEDKIDEAVIQMYQGIENNYAEAEREEMMKMIESIKPSEVAPMLHSPTLSEFFDKYVDDNIKSLDIKDVAIKAFLEKYCCGGPVGLNGPDIMGESVPPQDGEEDVPPQGGEEDVPPLSVVGEKRNEEALPQQVQGALRSGSAPLQEAPTPGRNLGNQGGNGRKKRKKTKKRKHKRKKKTRRRKK